MKKPIRIFLSYSHSDSEFVSRLEADLLANGVIVWRDINSINPGESITRSIEGALINCNAILLIISPQSINSSWVEREYRAALHLQSGNPEMEPRIIPCVIENSNIPILLRDILYADFRTYESGFISLAKSLKISDPIIPSIHFSDDIGKLLKRIEFAANSIKNEHLPVPSHELFEIWSLIENEFIRLQTLEISLVSPKRLDSHYWEISGTTDNSGRPLLDDEAYSRNLFYLQVMSIIQGAIQLAGRYGFRSNISADAAKLFFWLGGTPASN